MNQEVQNLYERYQKYESYADFAKMVGIGIAIGSVPILSITMFGVGGLVYAVGNLYNRKFRHTREDILKCELEEKVNEEAQCCKSCRYRNRL